MGLSCSSSQTAHPSLPPQRGENLLIPLLLFSPANPPRWASPGPSPEYRPKPAHAGLKLAERDGCNPASIRPTQRPTGANRGRIAGVSMTEKNKFFFAYSISKPVRPQDLRLGSSHFLSLPVGLRPQSGPGPLPGTAGLPAAPSPTKSDRQSACPTKRTVKIRNILCNPHLTGMRYDRGIAADSVRCPAR